MNYVFHIITSIRWSGGLFVLFFRIQLVVIPPRRIFHNVSYVLLVILTIADDMVVITALPNVFAVFFVTKSLEC